MKKVFKISVLVGCNFGAILGILISLLFSFMTGGSHSGGWYQAVEHDLGKWLSPDWAAIPWVVYSGIVLAVALISVIGALLGALFGAVVGKFLAALD